MTFYGSLAFAALATASLGANAGSVETNSYFLADNVTDTIPGEAGSVLDFGNNVDHTSASTSRLAGDTFIDNFVFNVPSAQNISFVAQSLPNLFSSGTQVSFDTFSLTAAADPTDVYQLTNLGISSGLITTNGQSTRLDSGVYKFTITGTINQNGALYFGALGMQPAEDVSPVPEPASIALLLAGLLAMGGVARTTRGRMTLAHSHLNRALR